MSLQRAIKKETSGSFEQLLLALAMEPTAFYAWQVLAAEAVRLCERGIPTTHPSSPYFTSRYPIMGEGVEVILRYTVALGSSTRSVCCVLGSSIFRATNRLTRQPVTDRPAAAPGGVQGRGEHRQGYGGSRAGR